LGGSIRIFARSLLNPSEPLKVATTGRFLTLPVVANYHDFVIEKASQMLAFFITKGNPKNKISKTFVRSDGSTE
jgi:hypothetical protein